MTRAKSFENPLISHARMRAVYRVLVETRRLSELMRRQAGKAGRGFDVPLGLEACWVGTALGLKAGDLASDGRGLAVVEHVRSAGMREGASGSTLRGLRQALAGKAEASRVNAADALLCAVGMAMALRSQRQGGAVMAYVDQGEVARGDWGRVLRAAEGEDLPLVVVAIPGRASTSRGVAERKEGSATDRVPVIPVDAGDAVALYRVAQESLGRVRCGGGAVVIECVSAGADPVAGMKVQLLAKKICTERWMNGVDAALSTMISRL